MDHGQFTITHLAIPPLNCAERAAVNAQPYFVQSTASASEVLTTVAVQDLFRAKDVRSAYNLSCHPSSSSAVNPWAVFGYVNLSARDDNTDLDSEPAKGHIQESDHEFTKDPTNPSFLPIPTPSSPAKRYGALEPASFPSVLHINKAIRLISDSESPSVVEVTFRSTYPDSPPEEDDDDEAINIPIPTFPHPHLLSPILEEDEEDDSDLETAVDDTSDTETIRPSSIISALPRVDTEIDWTSGVECWVPPCESSLCFRTDHRMSL
jgi:hypothetical protein